MYNFADASQWEPLFTKRNPAPGLGSIQVNAYIYYDYSTNAGIMTSIPSNSV
jgi:hypothetical protein